MDQYNIGDVLCNPLLYFNIQSNRPVNVVGGGVWSQWYHQPNTIYWAPGKSIKDQPDTHVFPPDNLIASSRDIDSGIRHVPCVSVMNKIVDLPIGQHHSFIIGNDDTVGFNIPDKTFSVMWRPIRYMPHFAQTNRISTNSYHAAYWGLLSGRKVRLYGYSSKFTSLLKGFGFAGDEYVKYRKGSAESFLNALYTDTEWLEIDHRKYKSLYREINLDFAGDVQKLEEIDCCVTI